METVLNKETRKGLHRWVGFIQAKCSFFSLIDPFVFVVSQTLPVQR